MKNKLRLILRCLLIPTATFCLLGGQYLSAAEDNSPPPQIEYKDYNLVLITLDTLRMDHLHCYGYFRKTSPNIDNLAKKSIFFENAFIQLPTTLPSHVSIFTGLYPQNTGVYRNYGRLDREFHTMAETLKNHGYRTGAVVSVALLNKKSGINQGFEDYYYNWDNSEIGETWGGWKVQGPANQANQIVFKWIEENQKNKFFFWVHYYDIHSPYTAQKGFADIFDPNSKEFNDYIRNGWDNEISKIQKLNITNYDRDILYTDYQLGRLIGFIKQLRLLKKTIVVITSDHGEGLYQHHGYVSHGEYLYDEQIRVPLIILLPDLEKQIQVKEIVQSVDLLPTLLDLLLIPSPSLSGDGKSLLPIIRGIEENNRRKSYSMRKLEGADNKPLDRWFSVRTPKYKLISGEKGGLFLYDMLSDPYEMSNLLGQKDEKLRDTEKQLREDGLKNFPINTDLRKDPPQTDSKTMRTLKSLGYMQ